MQLPTLLEEEGEASTVGSAAMSTSTAAGDAGALADCPGLSHKHAAPCVACPGLLDYHDQHRRIKTLPGPEASVPVRVVYLMRLAVRPPTPAGGGSEWEIDAAEIELGPRIGIGSFGEVFRGSWRHTDVAVKRFLEQDLSPQLMQARAR